MGRPLPVRQCAAPYGLSCFSTGRLRAGARAEAEALFRRYLELMPLASNPCSSCSCRATAHTTISVCVTCRRPLCEACGGPTGVIPLPLFRCCECLVAEYDLADVCLPASRLERQQRHAALLGLVRGRMLLLTLAKRRATRTSYAAGRKELLSFCTVLNLRALPIEPFMLMDWAVHDLSGKNLDSSTVKLRFGAAYDIYQYARTRLGLRALANPCRDAEVTEFERIMGANYKKRSKARVAVTVLVVRDMLLHGWDLRKAQGLWGRLRWCFLNFGMLRVGCTQRLIIIYEIVTDDSGLQSVSILDGSDISIDYSQECKFKFIDIDVDVDKNVKRSTGAARRFPPRSRRSALNLYNGCSTTYSQCGLPRVAHSLPSPPRRASPPSLPTRPRTSRTRTSAPAAAPASSRTKRQSTRSAHTADASHSHSGYGTKGTAAASLRTPAVGS